MIKIIEGLNPDHYAEFYAKIVRVQEGFGGITLRRSDISGRRFGTFNVCLAYVTHRLRTLVDEKLKDAPVPHPKSNNFGRLTPSMPSFAFKTWPYHRKQTFDISGLISFIPKSLIAIEIITHFLYIK